MAYAFLADLADAKAVSDKEIDPIRDQLQEVQNTLAAIEEALEPPSQDTVPPSLSRDNPAGPASPFPPAPAGLPEPTG